jgi:phenylalanyl-tRNA synthetase beta chain
MDHVNVGPSPKWLQNRLKAIGLKPINNVVDISNFVQRELGTPLHIFDAAKTGTTLEVRTAKANENLLGLDNTNYKMAGHELVIANQDGVLCLAGVLGGLESGVSEQTTHILIESALFDAVHIRKAARQHGLNTDASFRFERGVDPALTQTALLRCVGLLQELTGAQVKSKTFEFLGEVTNPIELNLTKQQITNLIGNDIPNAQIEQILTDLDFQIKAFKSETWTLCVPTYRIDVTRPVDVIEEILRIYGLNSIALPSKWNYSLSAPNEKSSEAQKQTAAEFLVGRGFYEVMNNSLSKKQYSAALDASFGAAIGMLNPLSQDLAHLRQTLLFGLLENLAYNQNRQQADLQIFEFGQDYQTHQENHQETPRLAIALMGKQTLENWNQTPVSQHTFFSLKKEVYAILERFGLANACKESTLSNVLFKQGLRIDCDRQLLVELGEISAQLQQDLDLKQPVYYAQFAWDKLLALAAKRSIRYQEVPKSFAVRRDLSLLVDQNTSYQALQECAQKAETKLLQDIQLFDVYEGKNLASGKKSYALAFYLQDGHQTLSETQIEKAMQRILKALETDCAAQLRN